ncbi:hypothetical protein HPP92_026278, partial [Vanilla planifolia]
GPPGVTLGSQDKPGIDELAKLFQNCVKVKAPSKDLIFFYFIGFQDGKQNQNLNKMPWQWMNLIKKKLNSLPQRLELDKISNKCV